MLTCCSTPRACCRQVMIHVIFSLTSSRSFRIVKGLGVVGRERLSRGELIFIVGLIVGFGVIGPPKLRLNPFAANCC